MFYQSISMADHVKYFYTGYPLSKDVFMAGAGDGMMMMLWEMEMVISQMWLERSNIVCDCVNVCVFEWSGVFIPTPHTNTPILTTTNSCPVQDLQSPNQ